MELVELRMRFKQSEYSNGKFRCPEHIPNVPGCSMKIVELPDDDAEIVIKIEQCSVEARMRIMSVITSEIEKIKKSFGKLKSKRSQRPLVKYLQYEE